MTLEEKHHFIVLWKKYFGASELPLIYYFTDEEESRCNTITHEERFIISDLARVRKGAVMVYDVKYIGCKGGILYTGINATEGKDPAAWARNLEKLIGEKQSGFGISEQELDKAPTFKAPARYLVFKRWDKIRESDQPDVVVFFATPDVISGLFVLSNYRGSEPNMAISPGASGCGSLLAFPYLQKQSRVPLAVIGMFDPSARVFLDPNLLSFAVPFSKFIEMVDVLEEGVLEEKGWEPLRKRMPKE